MTTNVSAILIVDDNNFHNALMEDAVCGIEGAEAFALTSPRDAVEFVRANPDRVGVAITDYKMPEMSGTEFIRAARQISGFEHVPIVMVTGHDERQIRQDALAAGATDFVARPFEAVEIKARVGNLLALNQARRDQQDRAAWLARAVAEATAVIEAREREIVTRLSRVAEHRDTDTGDHVMRVARGSKLIAERLGCDAAWCNQLELASLMHDIGKIAVPDAILLKPGTLTQEEKLVMMRHAEHGHQMLHDSTSEVIRLAAEVAISHHERWDGHGYPRGLRGIDIPLSGRIVAVADVFDALVSERPYKRAWTLADARVYLAENAGSQFDPACVRAFLGQNLLQHMVLEEQVALENKLLEEGWRERESITAAA